MQNVLVTRTYLRMDSPAKFRPAGAIPPGFDLRRVDPVPVELFRLLYELVGAEWHWRDRNAWTDEQVALHFSQPGVALWELREGTQPAGYFELHRQEDGSVEIVYFGLARSHFGRGLGRLLLSRAVQEAWALGASTVWLHTCSLDSPAAMPNYLARGFEPYRQEQYQTVLP